MKSEDTPLSLLWLLQAVGMNMGVMSSYVTVYTKSKYCA